VPRSVTTFHKPLTAEAWGLGTVVTSALFLAAILLTVIYLTITKKDAIAVEAI
jgi:uncharacterized membrane-anchored protein